MIWRTLTSARNNHRARTTCIQQQQTAEEDKKTTMARLYPAQTNASQRTGPAPTAANRHDSKNSNIRNKNGPKDDTCNTNNNDGHCTNQQDDEDDITALVQDIFLALREFPEAKEKLSNAMEQRLAARNAHKVCSQCGSLRTRDPQL
jgi:hypothetical protein